MDEKRRVAMATARVTEGRQEVLVDRIQAAVAEAVADQEERVLVTIHEPATKRSAMSVLLLVVLVGFIVTGLYSYLEIRKMSLPLDRELGVEAAAAGVHLYSIAMQLEHFREVNGHYPVSLDRMGLPVDGALQYTRISDTEYGMEYAADGMALSFRSTQPLSQLLHPGSDLQD